MFVSHIILYSVQCREVSNQALTNFLGKVLVLRRRKNIKHYCYEQDMNLIKTREPLQVCVELYIVVVLMQSSGLILQWCHSFVVIQCSQWFCNDMPSLCYRAAVLQCRSDKPLYSVVQSRTVNTPGCLIILMYTIYQ